MSKKTAKKFEPQEIEVEETPTVQSKFNKKLLIFPLLLLLVIVGVFIKVTNDKNNITKFKNKTLPDLVKKIVNNPSTKINIVNIKESNGVYEFTLELGTGANAQKYTSYITKDGKILFTSGIKTDVLGQQTQAQTQTQAKKLTCDDLTKTETPNLTAFIVSNCPYGLQMQRVFKKAIEEAPQLTSFLNVKYIGSITDEKIISMHGDKEAQENLKQICVREEQKDKYWDYISCYIKDGNSEACSATAGVNVTQISSCISDKNRGLKYAQSDFDLANKLGVSGSPTLILNGKQTVSEFDFGGRIPDAIKQTVCCASKNKPGFCSNTLSKDEVAVSFSKTDSNDSSGNNAPANCNQQNKNDHVTP
ncbi:MAG: hypothetical protein M1268_02740 [Patescibacteria group bacterium]|nr:hypothetical protein [Patescibacteria group bacterium]